MTTKKAAQIITLAILPLSQVNWARVEPLPVKVWEVRVDSGFQKQALDVAIDANGHVYATGHNGTEPDGGADWQTVKLSSNGVVVWVRTFDGGPGMGCCSPWESATGLAIDSQGDILVAGSSGGSPDILRVIKYDPIGTIVWNTTGNDPDIKQAHKIAIDASDNFYVAGSSDTYSRISKFSGTDASEIWTSTRTVDWYRAMRSAGDGLYLATRESGFLKYDSSDGTELWSAAYPNAALDSPKDVEVDANGNAYVVVLSSANSVGDQHVLRLLKYNSVGTLIWNVTLSTWVPRFSSRSDAALTFGPDNNLYLVAPPGIVDDQDIQIFKLGLDGSVIWDIIHDNGDDVTPSGIAVDADENIYVSADRHVGPPWKHFRVFKFSIPPLPPSALAATVLSNQSAKLDWQASPSTKTAQYNIYWDSGTGGVDYSVLLGSVPASRTTFTTDPLSSGTYRFGVRAQGANGAEEKNTNIVVSVAVQSGGSTAPHAAIKVPQSGRKVGGNRVTVMAEIIEGSVDQVKQVEFQYRSAASTTAPWNVIPSANINHPNPDKTSPYFIHWDVTGLANGDYELRAVAADLSGNSDPSPPTVVITVDNANPEIEEKVVGSVLQKRELVFNTISHTIRLGDQATDSVTRVALPSGAVNAATATIKIVVNPAGSPSPPATLTLSGQVRDIALENGQTTLNSPATLTFQYQDLDNDGLVDGTTARADKLAVYVYDTPSAQWRKEAPSSVDIANKTVTAQTPHFSLFGLFAPAASDLSGIQVYPVPFVPNDGVSDNGKPFSFSDPDSGIIFNNITQSVRIEIYTVAGELVWRKTTDSSSGKIQWDEKNLDGREVASGVYFTVIHSPATGEKVVKKIAIIR